MTGRRFYEDEQEITPIPGTNVPNTSPAQQKIVNGVLVNSPSSVESVFKNIRHSIHNVYSRSIDYVNSGYSKYYETERSVTSTFTELHDKREDLLPNAIYIIIGGLSGTVMARQRGILSKITFPLVAGIISFKYFLPSTFSSTTNFLWKLEKKQIPEVAHQQEYLLSKSSEVLEKIEQTGIESTKTLSQSVDSLRTNIKKYTGLNLDENATKK